MLYRGRTHPTAAFGPVPVEVAERLAAADTGGFQPARQFARNPCKPVCRRVGGLAIVGRTRSDAATQALLRYCVTGADQ